MTFFVALVIDLLIIALLVAFAFKGMRQGFLRSLTGIFTYIIAFAAAKVFSPMIAQSLKNASFVKFFAEKACGEYGNQSLSSADASTAKGVIDTIFSYFGDMAEDIKNLLGVSDIGDATLVEIVTGLMASLIAFLFVFILVSLLFNVVVRIFKKQLDKIEIFKKTDTVLGGVFGVFTGFFWAWIIAAIFVFMYEPISNAIPEWFTGETSDIPLMIKISNSYNPLKWLLTGIYNVL